MPQKPSESDSAQRQPSFDFCVPKHPPSSHVCPNNVKRPGKAPLVCVYHGRRVPVQV
ncbi:hypothetical protein BGZ63DRAFT_382376 [Mariannaea sp. PMI_226]|nr:hypothetical protein BGZ63DRAFT_382376 [Mariannaea sp. PMI_226]